MDPRLVFAKAFFFSTALCNVGWTRFQTNALLERGVSPRDVGILKGIGLVFKIFGELTCCIVADRYDPVQVFLVSVVAQILTLESIRQSNHLSFNFVVLIKFFRGITACLPTLTNALCCMLTEGTKEGYGHQRLFGSLAWGVGALLTGILIDVYGTDALFLFAYVFYGLSAALMVIGHGLVKTQKELQHLRNGSPPVNEHEVLSASSNTFHATAPTTRSKKSDSVTDHEYKIVNTDLPGSTQGLLGAPARSTMTSPRFGYGSWSVLLHETVRSTRQSVESMARVFSHESTRGILINILLYGIVMSIIDSILTVSLINDYKTSASFGGVYTSMGVVSCVPAFYLSSGWLERYGAYNMLLVSQGLCVVRLALNSIFPVDWAWAPYCILTTQLLHGANFALFWATMVHVLYKVAPPDMKNTALGLLNTLYYTVGGAIGNICWSILCARIGIRGVFLCGAAFLAVSAYWTIQQFKLRLYFDKKMTFTVAEEDQIIEKEEEIAAYESLLPLVEREVIDGRLHGEDKKSIVMTPYHNGEVHRRENLSRSAEEP